MSKPIPRDVLIESAPMFANFFLAYLKLDEEGRSSVNEMCSFLDRDERVPQSQRDMAAETIVEALFPEPTAVERG